MRAPKDESKEDESMEACVWTWGNYSYHSACGQYLRYKIPADSICPGCGKRIIEMTEPTKREEDYFTTALESAYECGTLGTRKDESIAEIRETYIRLAASAQSAERCAKCEYKARAERAEIAQVESLMNAPAQSVDPQEPEPGELITKGHCPNCGASLEVMYGDDEGEIGILSHGSTRPLCTTCQPWQDCTKCHAVEGSDTPSQYKAIGQARPSRSEAPELDDEIDGIEWALEFSDFDWRSRDPGTRNRRFNMALDILAKEVRRLRQSARPSREEEMRPEDKHCPTCLWYENGEGSEEHCASCLVQINDLTHWTARAALAQGGARDGGRR